MATLWTLMRGLGDRARLDREAICLLVELGVERDDAAVRVFELAIQRPGSS